MPTFQAAAYSAIEGDSGRKVTSALRRSESIRSDKGLTLETSAFELFTVIN